MNHLHLPNIGTLSPLEPPQEVSFEAGSLMLSAGAKTDLFVDPRGTNTVLNAPSLVFEPVGDFMLSTRVMVDFKDTFDAGVLLLWQNPESWAKLCFEYSPQGDPMVVSVVTKGRSDDGNSVFIEGRSTYLRISRLGEAFAFHHSTDGHYWHFVRCFNLEPALTKVGFLVQSPSGAGCTARFSELKLQVGRLPDLRSGA